MEYLNTPILNVLPNEAIVIAQLNGQIVSGNQKALDLYHYHSMSDFKKHDLKDLMPDDFAPFYPDEMTIEHINFDGYHTHVCKRKDGELFACKLHTHYQNINNKKYLIGHVKEIHDDSVDIEKLCLKQNIIVLQRELTAERSKNKNNTFQHTSQQIGKCFPILSNNDLKICSLIAQHFNSKQISQELNITTDGVYAARKRIRKKLQLNANENLETTLSNCCRKN
ncbi:PAS domain S-box protein [Carboxylicivirga sp. M1479]|uniref:LuxR C-terminal-related transcriptional regulator n=1 Tax=Carboxylicivirga sp. M1479 TaxID=2594476 RepID=UPI0011780F7F|nr:PAS domain S-box protein [Carboxylicivirga sp. M1479]TRX65761.1 PAS domain S-box protein [Carboxylicivirga sp. M1479]